MYQTSPIFQLEAFISREIGIFGNIFLVMLQKLKSGDVVRIKLRKFGNFLIYKKLKKFPIFFLDQKSLNDMLFNSEPKKTFNFLEKSQSKNS